MSRLKRNPFYDGRVYIGQREQSAAVFNKIAALLRSAAFVINVRYFVYCDTIPDDSSARLAVSILTAWQCYIAKYP